MLDLCWRKGADKSEVIMFFILLSIFLLFLWHSLKDISSGSSIKIADERAYLGPFRLDEGRNVVWSTSQVPGVYIKKQSLQYIGKLTVFPTPIIRYNTSYSYDLPVIINSIVVNAIQSNSYDLTIVIMPLFSTPTNKKQPAQVKHTTKTVIPQGLHDRWIFSILCTKFN
jgi:hypothetical protein